MAQHDVRFEASGRGKAQCAPDSRYPDGVDLDPTRPGEQSCLVALPYPAPECGMFMVDCHLCRMTVAITAAGRPDDPRSVRLPCNVHAGVDAKNADA